MIRADLGNRQYSCSLDQNYTNSQSQVNVPDYRVVKAKESVFLDYWFQLPDQLQTFRTDSRFLVCHHLK